MDATEYSFPDANLVIYFYNPFDEAILSQTLNNLHQTFTDRNRSIYVIYHFPPNPELLKDLQEIKRVDHCQNYHIYSNGKHA